MHRQNNGLWVYQVAVPLKTSPGNPGQCRPGTRRRSGHSPGLCAPDELELLQSVTTGFQRRDPRMSAELTSSKQPETHRNQFKCDHPRA